MEFILKWKKWVICGGIVLVFFLVRFLIGIGPISTTKSYVHDIVEGNVTEAMGVLIGQAKQSASQQKDLLKTKGNVLNEHYSLASIDWSLDYVVVDSDITVGLPDGTVDREKQKIELLKQDGVWKIARVETESPLDASMFLPSLWTDGGAKETVVAYINDQLANKKDAIQFLTGSAYTASITSQTLNVQPMMAKDIRTQSLGREPIGDLLMKVSYTITGNNIKDKQVELLVKMEKVGGVWKISSLEAL